MAELFFVSEKTIRAQTELIFLRHPRFREIGVTVDMRNSSRLELRFYDFFSSTTHSMEVVENVVASSKRF